MYPHHLNKHRCCRLCKQTVMGIKLNSQGQTQNTLCKGTKQTGAAARRVVDVDTQGEGCGTGEAALASTATWVRQGFLQLCFPAEKWTRIAVPASLELLLSDRCSMYVTCTGMTAALISAITGTRKRHGKGSTVVGLGL